MPAGLKHRVEAEQPAPLGYRRRLQVVHRHHQVGHPHPDEMAGDVGFVQGDGLVQLKIPHPGHGQLDPAALDFGVDEAGQGLKSQIFRGDAVHDGEAGGAAAAVAAHLGLGAVGVIKAPTEIGLVRAFDEDQPVGPDPELAVADPAGKPGLLGSGMNRARWSMRTKSLPPPCIL